MTTCGYVLFCSRLTLYYYWPLVDKISLLLHVIFIYWIKVSFNVNIKVYIIITSKCQFWIFISNKFYNIPLPGKRNWISAKFSNTEYFSDNCMITIFFLNRRNTWKEESTKRQNSTSYLVIILVFWKKYMNVITHIIIIPIPYNALLIIY